MLAAPLQLTRNEAALTVRQCTAVNPHVLALVAARVQPVSQPGSGGRRRGAPGGSSGDEDSSEEDEEDGDWDGDFAHAPGRSGW